MIGAGIVGLSTALFLARTGRDVLVIERAEPNALASGGNAGSLHAQLLSFDHGTKAAGAAGPAARTLPLQQDSIALWAQLERELGADFEMAITGGLMVAETKRDLDFLRAKTAVECAMGIDCEVIGAADLRALEPALSERFLGARPLSGRGQDQSAPRHAGHPRGRPRRRRPAPRPGRGLGDRAGGACASASRRRAGRSGPAASSTQPAPSRARIGRMLGAEIPVHGAPLQMIVTEPAAPILKHLVAHADRHLTLKQAGNGALLIGGGWTAGARSRPRPSAPAARESCGEPLDRATRPLRRSTDFTSCGPGLR